MTYLPRTARRGLTLVELMMVIVIIGILAGVVAVNLAGTDDKAKVAVANQDITAIRQAISRYTMESGGVLPETLEELVTGPPDYDGRWTPLFEDRRVPTDPWGGEYVYEITDPDYGEYTLTCYGKDGEPGGEGFAEDIIWPDPDSALGD